MDSAASNGTTADEDDTLRFAELTGVRPMIETYPLEKAAEGYERMLSGNAQFRVVLTMWRLASITSGHGRLAASKAPSHAERGNA